MLQNKLNKKIKFKKLINIPSIIIIIIIISNVIILQNIQNEVKKKIKSNY